jgi:hypothetical protein
MMPPTHDTSRRVRRRVVVRALGLLLLGGCGYGGPGPAEAVQSADLVGRWTGAGCIEGEAGADIELVLRADGAYSFCWLRERSEAVPTEGTWCLRGSMLWLSGGEWVGYASDYWLTGRSPTGFLLFGGVEGCPDPDLHMVLRWAPPGPGELRADR